MGSIQQTQDQADNLSNFCQKDIVRNASAFLTEQLVRQQQFYAIEWLCHFKVLNAVPLPPYAASYVDIAARTDVPEQRLRSIARMAMTADFMCENRDGELCHNNLSASFVEDRGLRTQLLHMIDHTVPVMSSLTASTERWGDTVAANETAYNISKDTDLPFFKHLEACPDLGNEFDEYMRSKVSSHSGTSVEYLLQAFDWSILEDAMVVDASTLSLKRTVDVTANFQQVGGGAGEASMTLAAAYPRMQFVVQDLPRPIDNARIKANELPRDISERIQLQPHDFFNAQPVEGANIYLLRTIIHDWPDADAVKILKRIANAMSPDSRLLIMDMVLPKPGTTNRSFEAALRQKDLTMLQTFNSRERETDDWHALIAQADSRFCIQAIKRPEGSELSVLEVMLR